MYKKHIVTFFLFILCSPLFVAQASVNIKADISPSAIRIGEQAVIDITIKTDRLSEFRVTPIEELNADDGYIEYLKLDTLEVHKDTDGKEMVGIRYTLTSFEDSLYYIEPIKVFVGGHEYQTNPLSIKVESVAIDTTELIGFGPKEVFPAYATWSEYGWSGSWGLSLLLFLLAAVLLWICLRAIERKPLFEATENKKPRLPIHEQSILLLNKLKETALGAEAKPFYTELTDILRTYMQKRYRFQAREMTSREILLRLQDINDAQNVSTMRSIFQTADLVKFAKQTDSPTDRTQRIDFSIKYIDQTKSEIQEATDENDPAVKVEKAGQKNKKIRRTFYTALCVLSLTVAGLMFYLISQLYDIVV